MKKFSILSTLLLAVMMLTMMVACSSDSEDNGKSIEYTTDQIADMLKGKWDVFGELRLNSQEESFAGKYKGTIEFKDNKNIRFIITEGDKYTYKDNGESIYLEKNS